MSLNWPLPECLHALVALSQSFPCLLKIRPDCRLSCAECREMRQASWRNDIDMSAVLYARPRNSPVWGTDHCNSDISCILPLEVIWLWSEVSYGEVPWDKSTMYGRVTLFWGYLIVLWLFHLVCILHCGCFNLFCNMWVSVCVGVLVICVLVFTVFCIVCTVFYVLCPLCIFILICFVCTSVRTTVTE